MKAIPRTILVIMAVMAFGTMGYGQTDIRPDSLAKDYASGSESTVSGHDMEKYLSTDILTSLQGRIAGFNISQYRGSDLPRISVITSGDLIGALWR